MIRSYESRVDITTALPEIRRGVRYPQPFDAHTLANVLRTSVQALWFFVLHAYTLYDYRTIPKKSGGKRSLHIPDARLAKLQRKILRTFLNVVDYPPWVSAYVPGRSPIDAAHIHAGHAVLIVLDLKDFFPSTKRAWVRDAFKAEFGLADLSTELLATLVTAPWNPGENRRFVVPQGAPTSGATANIVAMHRLDPHVLRVCEKYGMYYTRYADDLAFTREQPLTRDVTSRFICEIIRAIRRSGYRVNYEKIRVQAQNQQQRLLGMSINAHPNLPKRDYRRLRALVHQCSTRGYAQIALQQGFESVEALQAHLDGMLAYAKPLAPARIARLRTQLDTEGK